MLICGNLECVVFASVISLTPVSYQALERRVGKIGMDNSVISMLTQMKNAYMAKRSYLELPHTKFRESLSKLLVQEGYLKEAKIFKKGQFNHLHIDLLDSSEKDILPQFRTLRIISKPGQRIYLSTPIITRYLKKGRRNVVVSTSRGLMKITDAKKRKLGGEAVCEWS